MRMRLWNRKSDYPAAALRIPDDRSGSEPGDALAGGTEGPEAGDGDSFCPAEHEGAEPAPAHGRCAGHL